MLFLTFIAVLSSCTLNASESYPSTSNRLIEASVQYDTPNLDYMMRQEEIDPAEALPAAIEQSIKANNVSATRNLTEYWIAWKKNWFERHYIITMLATPVIVGMVCMTLRLKYMGVTIGQLTRRFQ